MTKYFYEGGPLFMGMLSIVLLIILALTIVSIVQEKQSGQSPVKNFNNIKSLGLFALVLGMLGQFIGLFSAFEIIGGGMEISPQMMAQGVKVSMITTIYGMIIFLVSYLLWFLLKFISKEK